MTREEAIRLLGVIDTICTMRIDDYGEREHNAIQMAIADMEKQIPKKLIKKWDYTRGNHDFHRWTCSKCERDIEDISADYEYCPYCGQKLDWGDEDD